MRERSASVPMVFLVACSVMACGCSKKTPTDTPAPPPETQPRETVAAQVPEAPRAEAKTPVFDPGTFIATVDKNRDGKVTKEEYSTVWKDQTVVERNFKILDRNGDGFITAQELATVAKPK